ncbi:MAG TPA: MFS transporter [Pyrinomonadaceae bacterium]|nr:MFS transporter [Pyrinomonadaceae bacterium]
MPTGRDTPTTPEPAPRLRGRVAHALGLERNVVAVSAAVLLMSGGEELWRRFLPKYLEALGAGALAVGFFGTLKDFLDAVYQYPGGWLADRFGRRRAFHLFIVIASVGYALYLFSPSWPFVFAGLVFSLAWQSMASPAIFAVIGDALPRERRAMGFTVQSLLKRVPMTLAPLAGGALIATSGVVGGVRWGLAATLVLAGVTAFVVRSINLPVITGEHLTLRGIWRTFHGALKRLLISDIIIRTCEGLTDIFVVLYVTNVKGVPVASYGVLVALQMATSVVVYVPAAKLADRVGRKPLVIATFVCFALFPVAVVASGGFASLVAAFVVGGLREIGEPSRKALIVDLAEPHLRARTVGIYYLVRSLSITPAAAVGGALWQVAPEVPFLLAGAVGLVGTLVFALTVEERYAG